MTRRTWTVRLSDAAQADYDEILRWTAGHFGATQAASYGARLATVLARLEHGPTIATVRQRNEIGAGLYSLHVGRRARHVILFRVGSAARWTLDVLRILHDAMDVARHLPDD